MKYMRRAGFSLIEIVIAMAISAVLSLILYNAFSQTSKLVQQVRDIMEDSSDTLSSYVQLKKDFSAIFMPAEEKVEKAAPAPQQNPSAQQQPAQTQQKAEPKDAKKVEIIPFKTTLENGKLATISFVTTNAFSILDEPAQRSVRVTYLFEPQEGMGKNLYTLFREEIPYDQKREISGEKKSSTKPARYALVRNISSYSAKFSAYDCKEGSKELVTLSEWASDEQKKKCPDKLIPEFVELSWEVMDLVTERTHPYLCSIAIPAGGCKIPKEKEKSAAPQQPQQQQQQASKGAPANQQAAAKTAAATPASAQGQLKTQSFQVSIGNRR